MPYFSKRGGFILSKVEGFSLVEMLIYLSILVLMLAVIMSTIVSIIRSDRIIKVSRSIEDSATVSIERLTRETRQAKNINVGLSILDSNPGNLVLEGTDASGNPRTVEFYLSEGRLLLKENGVDAGALTETDARISNLIFRLFTGPNAKGIKTEMTIESGTSASYRSGNFYSSALLR